MLRESDGLCVEACAAAFIYCKLCYILDLVKNDYHQRLLVSAG